jgi:hypothetical protein
VRLNAFKRHNRAINAAAFYSRCSCVARIDVAWSDPDANPPSDLINAHPSKITVSQFPSPSLNNRFVPLSGLQPSDAVFSVDDDVRVSCNSLELAMEAFNASPPGTLVGFNARLHVHSRQQISPSASLSRSHSFLSRKSPCPSSKWLYRKWWSVTGKGWYSIVLTKSAILSNGMLQLYTHSTPKEALSIVDARRNCEDLLMQFVATNATGQPPLAVRGSYTDSGAIGGISTTSSSHAASRGCCLDEFEEIFGHMVLKSSSRFVQPVSKAYFSAPTVLELLAVP